jgi:alcohol dehydrogenase class IV
MKQTEFIYPGAIENIYTILKENPVDNIFLVKGKQSFIKSGIQKSFKTIYERYNIIEFSEFGVNPKIEEARKGYDIFKKSDATLIIAAGGGSVIDMAKLIKYLIIQDSSIPPPTIIAIPTTAGTGSEATHFAVVYIDEIKYSYANEQMLPDIAIVDADLLKGQSNYQMAVSGIDAFAQGIESYWSIQSTEESMIYSEKAIRLMWKNLRNAIDGDKEALKNIAEGSNWAGKAINIAKTTAPHALSYGFTSKFGLPHGHAVALFLPFFFNYHWNTQPELCSENRGVDFIKDKIQRIERMLYHNNSNSYKDIALFINSCGLETDLNKLGITKEKFISVLELVNIERLRNNPVRVDQEILESIYKFNSNI